MAKNPESIKQFIYQDFADLETKNLDDEDSDTIVQDQDLKDFIEESNTSNNEDLDPFEFDENIHSHQNNNSQEELPEEKTDIEYISTQKYNEGYQKATEELQQLLSDKESENKLLKTLNEKLEAFDLHQALKLNISQEILEIITLILECSNKLLPTNFEQLFKETFLPIVQDGMELGNIEIKVHSSRKEIVAKIIAANIKDNISKIKLSEDDNLSTDDIKVDYANGVFQYKNDEIMTSFDKIISKNLNPE